MALNFPTNPADGQTYEGYVYDATAGVWNSDPHQIASRFVTSATAPSSPSEGDGWFDTNTAKSYVYYDGVWVQLGALGTVDLNQIADVNVSSPANGESLVYDGTDWVNQELQITSTIQDLTDTTISPPSEGDIMVYNGSSWINTPATSGNLLYNGAMQVAQRGTSKTGIATGNTYHTADRWRTIISGLGTWTQTVEDDGSTGSGLSKSLKIECTTANAAPASSDYFVIAQTLEGQDLQSIKKGTSSAKPLTLSFWVKSDTTGTYIASLYDSDNGRIISKSYSISTADAWEHKTITLDADTTGGLENDNSGSLQVQFVLGVGSNFTSGTLATSWEPYTPENRAVGQTNLAASTGNYWQVTGVQLEAGTVATPFEHKTYATELAECKRYYQKSFLYETAPFNNTVANTVTPGNPATTGGYGTSSGTAYNPGVSILEVEMRSTPSVQLYTANGNISSNNFGDVYNKNNTTSIPASVITDSTYGNYTTSKRIAVRTNNGSGITNLSNPIGIHWTADAEL